ncbi:MAG: leucine-rich repeat domain-containing protein, partial [Bacteroidaceae bacterium]|nr:leucine-rich repeat domain-containing protein [Bacteroidaceae bacterium]
PEDWTSIGQCVFAGCSGLTYITIPEGLTSIAKDAFANCSGLTSITIESQTIASKSFIGELFGEQVATYILGDGITSIGSQTFEGCSGLTCIILPESLTSIGSYAFDGCANIQSMIIKSGVLKVDGYVGIKPAKVFWLANTPPEAVNKISGSVNYVANEQYLSRLENCKVYPYLSSMFEVDGLKYVPVSPSERICDVIDCVYGDSTIAVVNIGETVSYKGIDMKVKKVMPYSFSGNGILRDVVIADAVESVGTGCFANCSSLERVKIGSNVSEIGNDAFKDCPLLSDILIPNATERIGNGAFSGCKSLSDVIIEDRSEPLALGCNYSSPLFSDCPLDSVYIGGKITYGTSSREGYSPFYRNTSLRTVVITDKEDQIYENEFYGCNNLKNVTIGNGVKSIGNYAFSGCSALEGFSFGSSMESIGNEAFSDCTNLTQLTSYAVTPPTCGIQALDDINKWNCVLKIPEGTNDAYMAADQWKEFFFIENLPAGINGIKQEIGKNAPVYNLNGTRVKNTKNMPKGVYIIKGKKVMVK